MLLLVTGKLRLNHYPQQKEGILVCCVSVMELIIRLNHKEMLNGSSSTWYFIFKYPITQLYKIQTSVVSITNLTLTEEEILKGSKI